MNCRSLIKELLGVYERGSGARNSWGKTAGLRVGSLRGSTYLPDGWVEGRDIRTQDPVIRYLGVFLGAREEVARKFLARTTQRIEDRLRIWDTTGVV